MKRLYSKFTKISTTNQILPPKPTAGQSWTLTFTLEDGDKWRVNGYTSDGEKGTILDSHGGPAAPLWAFQTLIARYSGGVQNRSKAVGELGFRIPKSKTYVGSITHFDVLEEVDEKERKLAFEVVESDGSALDVAPAGVLVGRFVYVSQNKKGNEQILAKNFCSFHVDQIIALLASATTLQLV
jgi:hypothetical protein